MILMNAMDVIRTIAGAYRVQMIQLKGSCSSMEASSLDFLFRDHLYEQYDYGNFAAQMMAAVPEDGAISYRDDFGLHYLVFRGRDTEEETFLILGPYVHHTYSMEEFRTLIASHGLAPESLEAIQWYFKRIPVIEDYLSWRSMLSPLLSRYLANPDLEIITVRHNHPEDLQKKPVISLSSIPYSSVEARYAVEKAMLEAIRKGDFSTAIYQQNLFMGFTLDQRVEDSLRDAKDMVIAVNTLYRKEVEMANVHPLYIDGISGHFVREIEAISTADQLLTIIPRMIQHYCLLVQQHSLEKYSEGVRNCINYIDFHYMEPLNLENLAQRFNMNKNYLSSRFHREVGKTVTDYINQTRVNRSIQLLRDTSDPVQAIAEKCGFQDANYFSRTFRKIRGETPNDYRRSLKQK